MVVKVTEELFWQTKDYKDLKHVEEMVNERSFLGYSSDVHGAKKISVRRIYDYETHDSNFESLLGYEIFIFSKTSRLALGPTQPPTQ